MGKQIFSTHSNVEHLAFICKFVERTAFPDWMAVAHMRNILDEKQLDYISTDKNSVSKKISKRKETALSEAPLLEDTMPAYANFESLEYMKLRSLRNVFKDLHLVGPCKENEVSLFEKESDSSLLNDIILFKDLIERCLELDPRLRLTPFQALQHDFICKSNNM